MKILFIGDIMGNPGRAAVRKYLADGRAAQFDFIIANGENVAGGKGLTPETAQDLFKCGVHALTGGNHTWRHREIAGIIEDERVLRPANYPPCAHPAGHGATVIHSPAGFPVGVVSLLGRTFMNHYEDPFACAESTIETLRRQTPLLFVDFHAEVTSEKLVMLHVLDGKATAVIGTHTHVQTADEHVTAAGTAYITDAGMTGPHDGIIGIKTEIAVRQLRALLPVHHEVATGDVHLSGVIIEADPLTGRAQSIQRVFDPPRT